MSIFSWGHHEHISKMVPWLHHNGDANPYHLCCEEAQTPSVDQAELENLHPWCTEVETTCFGFLPEQRNSILWYRQENFHPLVLGWQKLGMSYTLFGHALAEADIWACVGHQLGLSWHELHMSWHELGVS